MSEPPAHAAVVAPDASLLSPWFPGYEIEALVAVGRMGAVYRARQLSLDRPVAIKIMAQELSSDEVYCRSFETDAKAMARLSHPNLVGVYDFGIVGGMLYLIMEFVPGRSLLESTRGVPLAQEEVVRLITGIAAGLAHAHEHGVVHRDVRPSNVLLDALAEPKLGDFGLSHPTGPGFTTTGHLSRYIAPEARTHSVAADQRADVFSIGVMIHELLTGRHPVEDPRPASSIIDCDPRFDAVIQRATNAMPELRHPRLAALVDELQAILADPPATTPAHAAAAHAAPAAAAPVLVMAEQAHPARRGTIGTVALSLAAAIVGALVYKHFDRMSSAPRAQAQPTPTPSAADHGGPTDRPAATPSASSVWKLDFDPPPVVSTVPPEPGDSPAIDPAETFLVPPAKAIPVVPKFDVPAFLGEARSMMRDRARPLVDDYREELRGNVWTFEKSMQFAVGKLPKGRNEKSALVAACIRDIRSHGNRIPDRLDPALADIPDIDGYHTDAFARQKKIDHQLRLSLDRLAENYTVGIHKQIERLQKEDDPAAVNQLQLEIERIRDDEDRFMILMLGGQPDDETDPADWE